MGIAPAAGMPAERDARLAAQLMGDFTVMVPRLIGYGASGPFDAGAWTLDAEVDAIEAVVTSTGGPVHLVGHSFGGWIAMRFTRRRPESISTLSLYEPTTFGLLHEADDRVGLADLTRFIDDPRFLDPARAGDPEWMGAFVDYWNQAAFWSVMTPEQHAPLIALAPKVFAEVSAVFADRTRSAGWASIACPTLLMIGARTTPAADRTGRLLGEVLPHVEMVIMSRAAHLAPLVRVGPISAQISKHIARYAATAAT